MRTGEPWKPGQRSKFRCGWVLCGGHPPPGSGGACEPAALRLARAGRPPQPHRAWPGPARRPALPWFCLRCSIMVSSSLDWPMPWPYHGVPWMSCPEAGCLGFPGLCPCPGRAVPACRRPCVSECPGVLAAAAPGGLSVSVSTSCTEQGCRLSVFEPLCWACGGPSPRCGPQAPRGLPERLPVPPSVRLGSSLSEIGRGCVLGPSSVLGFHVFSPTPWLVFSSFKQGFSQN